MSLLFKVINEDKLLHFNRCSLEKEEFKEAQVPSIFTYLRTSMTKIGEDFYFYKRSRENGIINELLGCYFAKAIGLSTVQYHLGKNSSQEYWLLSKLFFEPGFEYKFVNDYLGPSPYPNGFNYLFPSIHRLEKFKKQPMFEDALKLIALDLFMWQVDRNNENIQLKEKEGEIFLAPVYDYGSSYDFSTLNYDFYENPLVIIRKNTASLKLLFLMYPKVYEYLHTLMDIPMRDALEDIEREHGIEIQEEIKDYYIFKQLKYNEKLGKPKMKIYH